MNTMPNNKTVAANGSRPAASSPLDVVPNEMPFDVPYGQPISLARAQAVIDAAMAEATRRNWKMNVAITDSGGNLVAFQRMDGAMLASIQIAKHKARAAATFRRPTKIFEDGVQRMQLNYLLAFDGIIASRGGIPLIDNGAIVGAIGCSGGTDSQDEIVSKAGAAIINQSLAANKQIRPQKNFKENQMATMSAPVKPAVRKSATIKTEQLRLTRRSPAYWRVTIDNPPINVMGPEMVRQFQEVINALEADEQVRVVVFDSAVEDYFLNHSDFVAKLEDLTSMPAGPTGLPPWPDFLARLTRLPVVSIALIRGRATGNGSEITLACDMSFASREKTIISQWEVGVGMVAGGGPMARLPHLIGRNRALEVLLSSEDLRADQAEAYGYVNRALPEAELDAFVDTLATRIAGFDKWAIATTKRLVNTSLPPDVELDAGWDACIASLGRPAAQNGIKALMARGFHKPGDVENRLGYYLGQI